MNNNRTYKKNNIIMKDYMNKDSQKINSLFNAVNNKIFNIELIKNMIIVIEYNNDNSSKQSYVSMKSSSLIISNGYELLLDKFDNKISYYKDNGEKIQKELIKRSIEIKI